MSGERVRGRSLSLPGNLWYLVAGVIAALAMVLVAGLQTVSADHEPLCDDGDVGEAHPVCWLFAPMDNVPVPADVTGVVIEAWGGGGGGGGFSNNAVGGGGGGAGAYARSVLLGIDNTIDIDVDAVGGGGDGGNGNNNGNNGGETDVLVASVSTVSAAGGGGGTRGSDGGAGGASGSNGTSLGALIIATGTGGAGGVSGGNETGGGGGGSADNTTDGDPGASGSAGGAGGSGVGPGGDGDDGGVAAQDGNEPGGGGGGAGDESNGGADGADGAVRITWLFDDEEPPGNGNGGNGHRDPCDPQREPGSCINNPEDFFPPHDATPTPTPAPIPGCAMPGVAHATWHPTPVVPGKTISVWGGGNVSEFPAPLATSYWTTVNGVWTGYIPGAPAFVNAAFLARFPGGNIPACLGFVVFHRP